MADLNGKIESASVPILVTIAGSGPQGKPGEPGKTPVLGVDYFTEEDKQEIATQVEESIRSDLPDIGGSVSVDETLTQSGKAADAKATGDRIGEIQANMVEHEPMTEPIEIYDPAFSDTLADLTQQLTSLREDVEIGGIGTGVLDYINNTLGTSFESIAEAIVYAIQNGGSGSKAIAGRAIAGIAIAG